MTMINMQFPYVDNLGVNSWYSNLIPNLITVHTRWGLTVGLGMRLITWLMRG